MKMMSQMFFSFLLVLVVNFAASAKPGSCVGRCGEAFTRGQLCTCDVQCASHNECCKDFDAVCTAAQSCRGRCGETFRRGRLCHCDPQCVNFNTCCHDYRLQCDARQSQQRGVVSSRAPSRGNRKPSRWTSNSESEERFTSRHPCTLVPGAQCPTGSSSQPAGSQMNSHQQASAPLQPVYLPPRAAGGNPDFDRVLSHSGVSALRPNQGLSVPADIRPRPNPLQDIAAALGLSLLNGASLMPERGPLDDLCSDSPISGLTALSNGTIVIFKGELFWTVDPVSRVISHPQSITELLGVPSHIDTVFTRSNCQGNVYIIKGEQYWRLDRNLVLEPGFPKPLSHEFPGLTSGVTAALSAPATVSRAETVFFFKKGDIMHSFTFPSSNIPACSVTPRGFVQTHSAPQAVLLSKEIHLKVSMMGFPIPVTSALSTPIPLRGDQYEHYVFSGPLFFSVIVSGDLPALVKPDHPPPVVLSPIVMETSNNNAVSVVSDPPQPANSIRVWLQCPV